MQWLPIIGKKKFNFSNLRNPARLADMKSILLSLGLVTFVFAEELPPASQVLAAARAQLPAYPVVMNGTLKQRAANGFIKKTLNVEIELNWNAQLPHAEYKISDSKTDRFQTLEIKWNDGEPRYVYSQNGENETFDPHAEIESIGVTWSDLSFSFLWSPDARTQGTGKKLGKECFKIWVPRPDNHVLLLWVEQKTGRLLGAEEQDAAGARQKIIKVVSVKDFDGLWMVKDLDIIQSGKGGRTSLRVDHVEARP